MSHMAQAPQTSPAIRDTDTEGLERLGQMLALRYPRITWATETAEDGTPYAIFAQTAEPGECVADGNALALFIQPSGAAWEAVCDGVTLADGAESAGTAGLMAMGEIAYQWMVPSAA